VPGSALDACDQLLHGDSANRWFDKALSVVVFADGTAGRNVEHSGLDGLTIVDLLTVVLGSAEDHSRRSGAHAQGVPWHPIEFDTGSEMHADIAAAAASFASAAADTATAVL
jgi:carnitine O-acetyltransferase